MAEVRVLGGRLREAVGAARLELPGEHVRELLRALADRRGAQLRALLFDAPDALHRDLRVLVNGRSIEYLDGLDTPLGERDAVTLHQTGMRGWPGG